MGQGITRWCALCAAGVLLNLLGCAKAPSGAGSGIRLVVTMRFEGEVYDPYHYFVLIRNQGDDIGRNGPIPVFEPPYGGNGFATAKSPSNGLDAFTDFVEYSSDQKVTNSSGYTLYHVPGGTQANSSLPAAFFPRGSPVATQRPNGGKVLQFELDLSQLTPETADIAPSPDNRPRYLQLNFLTTSTVPENSAIFDSHFTTDAIGDQRSREGTYVTIDTSQIGKTYQSNLSPGPEELSGDVNPIDDPRLDLVFWSVQVVAR